MTATLSGVSNNDVVQVIELVRGQRSGGRSEVQVLTILSQGAHNATDLSGWFRMSFNGSSTASPYVPAGASAADVANALNQLNTLASVVVTRATLTGTADNVPYAGYQWHITFANNFGNQPDIAVDSADVRSLIGAAVQVTLDEGDNSLTYYGYKASDAVEGEYPVGYNYAVVPSTQTSYTITGLAPGDPYTVAVSAINSFGAGPSTVASPQLITPPLQIPQPPSSVTLNVHPMSSTQLDVFYLPPPSDGGSSVLSYRIELDTTSNFLNPIYTVVPCPTSNYHTTYEIRTSGGIGDPVVSGYFQLTLTFNGASYTTDYISYDAPAIAGEELGVSLSLTGGSYATLTPGATVFTMSANVATSVFIGNRLQFDVQKYPNQVYIVTAVNGTHVTVDHAIVLADSTLTTTFAVVTRLLGGLGDDTTSRVACDADPQYPSLCPLSRRKISGSIQSKLEMIPGALTLGVEVDRDAPDTTNGMTWRVTFLDEANQGPENFALTVATGSNNVLTQSGRTANITVTNLIDGQVFGGCTGIQTVFPDKPLVQGQLYYARVFAINSVGFSLAGIAPSPQKPMVVPGPPTSVVLVVVSSTELRVSFNPPTNDGGDAVTLYRVDYSISNTFSNMLSSNVTYLNGGAPFFKTITGLTTGTFYFVRVSALNSQGFGPPALSTPASLNPYSSSQGPTNVNLYVTSDTLLTVSFGLPLNNGGDAITGYRVEWDISIGFNSATPIPNKGYVDLDASLYSSYTIQYLTAGVVYYVRVFAINSAGVGLATSSSPQFASPKRSIPGRPHTIQAYSGNGIGYVTLTWLRPRIPWFNVPCDGTLQNPQECPSPVGGGLPESDGDSPIIEYVVSWNEYEDFTGLDTGSISTAGTSYTLTGLIPGRRYYLRVLARNAVGSG